MLLTFISSCLLVEKRREILENFPDKVKNLWYEWELQVLILLSLFCQILVILLGRRRKHITGITIGLVTWVAYLFADSVAAYALGILTKTEEKAHSHSDELSVFWAPFLLLHLGGPDTITAYAIEDNELWIRHLLDLCSRAIMTIVVIYTSWTATPLSVLTVLIFVTGIIKYGERIFALRSASKGQFRDSMLNPPEPGPNYAKFMAYYDSKEDEGYEVDIAKINEDVLKLEVDQSTNDLYYDHHTPGAGGKNNTIQKAYDLFERFKLLFADLILSFQDKEESQSLILKCSSDEAFKLIEIELGFIFDVLYTKAPIVYTKVGGLFRAFCFCLIIVVFAVLITVGDSNHRYANVDILITYVLVIVAVILEIYAVFILLLSDWALLWLSKHKMSSKVNDFLEKRIKSKKRWSNSMGQYNLLDLCIKDVQEHTNFTMALMKHLPLKEKREIYWYTSFEDVPAKLKELIFKQLKERLEGAINNDVKSEGSHSQKFLTDDVNDPDKSHLQNPDKSHLQKLLGCSIDDVYDPDKLKELVNQQLKGKSKGATNNINDVKLESDLQKLLGWSIDEVEFHQRILLWHIATDLCYESDINSSSDSMNGGQGQHAVAHPCHWIVHCGCWRAGDDLHPSFSPSPSARKESRPGMCKLLSDYMFYLLISQPFMLPEGIGTIRFRDTRAEAAEVFAEAAEDFAEVSGRKNSDFPKKEACKMLLKVNTNILPEEVKGDRSKSVLFDACRLAKNLLSLEADKKWKVMAAVWVGTLSYAASQCRGANHAKQLSRGGELLTHAWLLMAHLGMTEQFQISQGQVWAKLMFK